MPNIRNRDAEASDERVMAADAGRRLTAEAVGTALLLAAVVGSGIMADRLASRRRTDIVPFAVAAYIPSAYWFTASTSFANPAVTFARALTDTFAGIRPLDIPRFVVAQFAGAAVSTLLFRWLVPALPQTAEHGVMPRSEPSPS